MSEMLEKLKKNSTIKASQTLSTSKFFDVEMIPTRIPALNIALSGAIDGGFCRGLTFFCGPSKHFKTSFALILVKAYMDKYKDSVLLFYDSEFGAPQDYFESFGIDTSRVLHTPIKNVEEFKFDLIQQLENITEKDNVIIMADSIGNLASKKEIEDAIDKKSVADMSRAKALKGLFRMITPYLTMNNIPMIAINHTYQTQELYCLAGETAIKTATGIKHIKDIDVGEYVYALNGLKKVTRKYLPEELPKENVKYLKLTFDDGSEVKCTNTHKFLMCDNNWVDAENIKIGDVFKCRINIG